MINNIYSILLVLLSLELLSVSYSYADDESRWNYYKDTFISKDGRIIDFGQKSISHSEGQGYGMLLAFYNDDRKTFDKIWTWTRNNIQVRGDYLLAWKWGERPNGVWQVIDYNNATDGDILVAYSLLLASEKWDNNPYKQEALKIIQATREQLTVKWQDKDILLPGYKGFVTENTITINPSYFIFPAYKKFSSVDEPLFWKKIYNDSYIVLSKSIVSPINLPPDWIEISGSEMKIDKQRGTYFSYDAIRVPLYISMDNKNKYPPGITSILDYYVKNKYIPRRIDLLKNEISTESAPAGFYAIFAKVAGLSGRGDLESKLKNEASERLKNEDKDYYSYTLYMLANVDSL